MTPPNPGVVGRLEIHVVARSRSVEEAIRQHVQMSDSEVRLCARCQRPVTSELMGSYEALENMHWVCFHYEFEHGEVDVDRACTDPSCPSRAFDRDAPPPGW